MAYLNVTDCPMYIVFIAVLLVEVQITTEREYISVYYEKKPAKRRNVHQY